MRIAQIAPLFESVPPRLYGGTERVVHNLTRGLTAAGHEVVVFCSGDSQTTGRMVHVWPEALRLSKRKITDAGAYQVRSLEMVARVAHEFDVIHNHYDLGLLGLARRTDRPVLTTMHNRLDTPDVLAALEMFYDLPLISISNAHRRGLPKANWIGTIYHGLDIDHLKFHPGSGSRGYLAFLGRFSPEKGPAWAIDIALAAGIPLKMAAKIDEYQPEYYERVLKPRIDGRFIEYVGEIGEHEKADFLGNALALVNPINWPEPFGLVMVEAMACGTPVLTRPVGSAPEIVVEGATGFLRSSIHELAAQAHEASRLNRREIRGYVETHYSIERMTREYINVYGQLIARAGSREQTRRLWGIRTGEGFNKQAHAGGMAYNRWDLLYPVHGPADGDLKGIA